MRITSILSASALASTALAAIALPRDVDESSSEQKVHKLVEDIKADVLNSLDKREAELLKRGEQATCNARNIAFRRE